MPLFVGAGSARDEILPVLTFPQHFHTGAYVQETNAVATDLVSRLQMRPKKRESDHALFAPTCPIGKVQSQLHIDSLCSMGF